MKKLLTLLLSLSVFSAMGQYQSEAFIKQQEKLYKSYRTEQTTSIVLGSVSALCFTGYGVTLASKPVYTYTGTSLVKEEAEKKLYNDRMSNWKTAKISFLVGGAATGVTSIVLGILSAKHKHLYETNKMVLRITGNNGIGLCLQLK